jgi:hypothetical protein
MIPAQDPIILKLVDALGLDLHTTQDVTINIPVNGIVTADVQQLVTDEQAKELVSIVRTYALTVGEEEICETKN